MATILAIEDAQLRKQLHQMNDILNITEVTSSLENLLQVIPGTDYLILSDRIIQENFSGVLADLIEKNQSMKKMIYLMSNQHDEEENERVKRFCSAYDNIHVIYPGKSIMDIVQIIQTIYLGKQYREKSHGKLITFIGTTPHIGTSFIALNTAIQLARRTIHKVAYIDLNLKSPKVHRHCGLEITRGLDSIRADLTSQTLDGPILRRNMSQLKSISNLDILVGTQHRKDAKYFTLEEISHLLHVARNEYDVIICDVHAFWDNASTYQAVMKADRRVLITTPEITCFQEDYDMWIEGVALQAGISKTSFDLFINQSYGSFNKKDIAKETNLNVIGEIHYLPEIRESINRGIPLLLDQPYHELGERLQPLLRSITHGFSLVEKEGQAKKRFIDWKFLSRKKEGVGLLR